MRNFEDVVKEIKHSLNNLVIFDTFMNSAIIFLACYLALSITGMQPLYALVPAAGFLLASLFFKLRENKILAVESAYPELREKLRTAADYANVDNPIVDELQQEAMRDMKKVEVAAFLKTSAVSYRVLTSLILSFLIIMVAVYDIKWDLNLAFKKSPDYKYGEGGKNPGDEEGDVRSAGEGTSDNIFGDETVAKLGEKDLKIALKTQSYEISLRDFKKPEKREFADLFPKEISAQSSGSYEESIPQEQQELVKNYFKKLAQS